MSRSQHSCQQHTTAYNSIQQKEHNNSGEKCGETCTNILITATFLLLDKLARILYNARVEQTNYINVRVRKDTHHKLRILAALTGKSMLDVLEQLVTQELERVQKGGPDATHKKDQAHFE
jgi:hypothetical protein